MKHINITATDPKAYCLAIQLYSDIFAEAYDIAREALDDLLGSVAETEFTKEDIANVLAAKIIAKWTGDNNITKHQHDLWSWHRLKKGWTFGILKTDFAKTDPCLKHFSLLTKEEAARDRIITELFDETVGDVYLVNCYVVDASGEVSVLVDTFGFTSEEEARKFMKEDTIYDRLRLEKF